MASQVALEAEVNVKQSFLVPFKSWRTISGTAPVVAPELVCLLTPNAVVATVQETIPKLLFLGSAQRPVPPPVWQAVQRDRKPQSYRPGCVAS